MSGSSAISGIAGNRIGPGRLILIVGPSGAGKDTLIGLVRTACADDPSVVFPRRKITREASPFEENDFVSPEEFEQQLKRGEFGMNWRAHGLSYGVPRSMIDDIRAGSTVIVNVSRTMIEIARDAYSSVQVVSVTAPPDVLAARLVARQRKSDGQISERVHRTVGDGGVEPDFIIDNVGNVDSNAFQLLAIVRGLAT